MKLNENKWMEITFFCQFLLTEMDVFLVHGWSAVVVHDVVVVAVAVGDGGGGLSYKPINDKYSRLSFILCVQEVVNHFI